jgi:Protein of unknown function (DUF763)
MSQLRIGSDGQGKGTLACCVDWKEGWKDWELKEVLLSEDWVLVTWNCADFLQRLLKVDSWRIKSEHRGVKLPRIKRSGTADLPLHRGHVPPWLANRMMELGTAIAEQVILNYGQSGFLTRLSDPFWFQSYGAVMGMDWHSSGITTSVLGALKRGMNPPLHRVGRDGLRGTRKALGADA